MGEGDGERWKDSIERRLDDHEVKIDNLQQWRSWVLGAVAGIGLIIGAFAKQIIEIIKGMGI
jgi:hypothetical protein